MAITNPSSSAPTTSSPSSQPIVTVSSMNSIIQAVQAAVDNRMRETLQQVDARIAAALSANPPQPNTSSQPLPAASMSASVVSQSSTSTPPSAGISAAPAICQPQGRGDPSSIKRTPGVTVSGLDISSLERQVCCLIESGLAANTRKVYNTAISLFLSFCHRLQLVPVPASKDTLLLFIAEPSQTRAYNTVHTYLAGVRHLHVIPGRANPLEKALRVQLALRGYKRTKPPQANPRLPITPHILRLIKNILMRAPHKYNNILLWVVVCLDFFGFLRSGEFVLNSRTAFNPDVHLTPSDVAVDDYRLPP